MDRGVRAIVDVLTRDLPTAFAQLGRVERIDVRRKATFFFCRHIHADRRNAIIRSGCRPVVLQSVCAGAELSHRNPV